MRLGTLLLAAAVCAAPCSIARASSFTGIVSFGDSLTDAGNVSIGTLGILPGSGYATRSLLRFVPFPVGYYTNPQFGSGPSGLWIDQLAGKLGVADPMPSFTPILGGTNYAIGSAFTAGFNGLVPGMDVQVADFLGTVGGHAPSTDLYTLWGGANDITSGLNPVAAADHVAAQISALAADGGKTFLWLNLPPLGEIPGLSGNPALSSAANLASLAFDNEWLIDLNNLDSHGLNVIGVNVDALFTSLVTDPGAYGFTNVTSACNMTPGCNPNTFLYWDSEHPTTEADSLIAGLANQDLAPTPEPPSAVLVALGVFFAIGLVSARRQLLVSC
jgi:outer membrane lipase/esterase